MRKYLAFDIEIARVLPENETNWKSLRPLGITCAATLSSDNELITWHNKEPGGQPGDRMNQADLLKMVNYLEQAVANGYTILTWNGMGFDFDILSEESGLFDICRKLAWKHVDMMFHFFCLKGFPLGLDKAAKGMGLPGKTAGMTGDMAPILWNEGKRQQVLEYVSQDVRTTLDLAAVTERNKSIHWISNTGKPQSAAISGGWLTVEEAVKLPEPDTSWMKTPMLRAGFTSWATR
jgi:hypothetical protein